MALQDATEEQQISLMELRNAMREQIDERCYDSKTERMGSVRIAAAKSAKGD